ncbi:putative nuclease of the RNAse H fold, HicB family [Candidatus Methanophagaceae archaeon]|nr:putative nuclease of the RNAse H fold, HicB family [Methanophagales archaeon]
MLTDYIEAVMSKARYEIIEDEEPYYGEVAELEGVWASGKTLEECRKNLAGVIDGWIIVKLRKGLPLPPIGAYKIEELSKVEVSV